MLGTWNIDVIRRRVHWVQIEHIYHQLSGVFHVSMTQYPLFVLLVIVAMSCFSFTPADALRPTRTNPADLVTIKLPEPVFLHGKQEVSDLGSG